MKRNGPVVSADSDLSAAIKSVRNLLPEKRIIIAFPPQRHSAELGKQANNSFVIGRANPKCVFPMEVPKADGFILRCPDRVMEK